VPVIGLYNGGGPSRAIPFHTRQDRRPTRAGGGGLLFGGGDEDGGGDGGCGVTDGDGDGDGDGEGGGDGDADGDGFGEGLGDGLPDRLGFVEDEDAAGSRIGGGDVASAAGDDEDLALAESFGEDSWSEICCTAATEWAEVRGPGPLRASAVLAATTAPTPTAMATRSPVIRRNTEFRSTVLPWSPGGAPESHSAASTSAVSPSCDRPRCCHPRP
jgi:hypothetical protein